MTPTGKTKMEADWSAAWNPSEPIELLFDLLEDCYVISVDAKPAYTQDQMIDKAITAIQRTGLYPTDIFVKWGTSGLLLYLSLVTVLKLID